MSSCLPLTACASDVDCKVHGTVAARLRAQLEAFVKERDEVAARLRAQLEAIVKERDEARAATDVYVRYWQEAHAEICKLGEHVGCGGIVRVVDSGSGALQCDKCEVQDWRADCGPYDASLIEKIETEKVLREQRDALREAIDFMRSRYSAVGGRACVICVYENERFVQACRLHEALDALNKAHDALQADRDELRTLLREACKRGGQAARECHAVSGNGSWRLSAERLDAIARAGGV